MSGKSYEFAVEGMDVPDGEIPFAQLGALASSLQSLVNRIGRQLDARSGPGRTPISLGRATEIRLVGLREGSTKLDIDIGDPNTIDLPDEAHALLAERFEEIIAHVQKNDVPDWADHLIGEATMDVVRSFQSLGASEIRLSRIGQVTTTLVGIDPLALNATIWDIEPLSTLEATGNTVRAAGRLEAVDLRGDKFRIRDDSGRAIKLDNVVDAVEVARLVGGRVIATGEAVRDSRGRLSKIDAARVWSHAFEARMDDAIVDAEPLSHGVPAFGFSDSDLEAFLRDLRS